MLYIKTFIQFNQNMLLTTFYLYVYVLVQYRKVIKLPTFVIVKCVGSETFRIGS